VIHHNKILLLSAARKPSYHNMESSSASTALTGSSLSQWPLHTRYCHLSCQHLQSAATGTLLVPRAWTATGQQSFAVNGPATWNRLPPALRSPDLSKSAFKRALKTHLFSTAQRHWDVFMILAPDINIQTTYLLTQQATTLLRDLYNAIYLTTFLTVNISNAPLFLHCPSMHWSLQPPLTRLASQWPISSHMTPADILAQWQEDWKLASAVSQILVPWHYYPTARLWSAMPFLVTDESPHSKPWPKPTCIRFMQVSTARDDVPHCHLTSTYKTGWRSTAALRLWQKPSPLLESVAKRAIVKRKGHCELLMMTTIMIEK